MPGVWAHSYKTLWGHCKLGGHLQAKDRHLRRNQTWQQLDFRVVAPTNVCCLSHPVCGPWYGRPSPPGQEQSTGASFYFYYFKVIWPLSPGLPFFLSHFIFLSSPANSESRGVQNRDHWLLAWNNKVLLTILYLPEILPHKGNLDTPRNRKEWCSPLSIQKQGCKITILKLPSSTAISSFSEGFYQLNV